MYKDDKQNSIDGYLHESTFRVPRNAVAALPRNAVAKKRKRKGEKGNGEAKMEKQQSSNAENQKCKENDRKKQQK